MDLGLIDVREWQTVVDLSNGRPTDATHPMLELGRDLAARYSYPGDLHGGGDRWVTDVALEVDRALSPGLLCMDYAGLYFPPVFGRQSLDTSSQERKSAITRTFGEIERFVAATDFEPVIIGLGELMPLIGQVDTTGLDGVPIAGGMTVRYAGLNRPSAQDITWLEAQPGVERVISVAQMREEMGGNERFYATAPEYLALAEEGWVFRGVNTGARPLYAIPAKQARIPVHGDLPELESLVDISAAVLEMAKTRRVALILVEATGCETFPLPHQTVDNTCGWYHYAVSDTQYRAISTGEHLLQSAYPPGYQYELYDTEDKPYPYSGIFRELPENGICRHYDGPTAAVGARAVMTHSVFGADFSIECFVRALYNHGVMATVHG